MIFTHTGKLGDFFLTLPIANWYYRTYGEKIHYVLSSDFYFFKTIIPDFIKYLPYVEKMTLVPHKIEHYMEGGQPYKFNPADYGIEGKYFNLGYRKYPDKYISLFIAEEYDLNINYRNLINIAPNHSLNNYKLANYKVYTNEYDILSSKINKEDFIELSFKDTLYTNISKMLGASEIRTYMSGFSILCDLLRPECTYIYTAIDIEHYGPFFYKNHNYYLKNKRYINTLPEKKDE